MRNFISKIKRLFILKAHAGPGVGKWLIDALISIIVNVAVSFIFRKQTDNHNSGFPDTMTTQINSSNAIPIIYGEVKYAGNLIWQKLSDDKQTIDKLIVFGDGKIESISDLKINEIEASTLSEVTSNFYLGDGVQEIDSRVTGATQTDKAKVVGGLKHDAYVALTARASDTLYGDFNVTAQIKGSIVRKFSRTAQTGYTLDSDLNLYYKDEWSDNPAWCILDFYTRYNGIALPYSDILVTSFIDAATFCDELVTKPDNTTQKRFTLNIVMAERKPRIDWLQDLMLSCRAYPIFRGGKHGILIEKAEAISQVFTPANMAELSVWWSPMEEVPDIVKLYYLDPEHQWTKVEADADVDEYLRPNNPYAVEVNNYGVTNFNQASRLAWFYLNLNTTCQMYIKFKTDRSAMRRSAGDIIAVTDFIEEFDNKPYRILQMSEPQDDMIELTCREFNYAIYCQVDSNGVPVLNDDGEYIPVDPLGSAAPTINDIDLPNIYSVVPQVTNMNAIEFYNELGNGTATNEVELTWETNDLLYKEADVYMDSTSTWEYIGTYKSRVVVHNLIKGVNYKFKVVAENISGRSASFDDAPYVSLTIVGKEEIPSPPANFVIVFTDKAECSWNIHPDPDINFYELRLDDNPGEATGLLVKTTSTKSYVNLTSRTGTIYLYAHDTSDHYSTASMLTYAVTAPIAPSSLVVTEMIQGLKVVYPAPTNYCYGANIYINGILYFNSTGTYMFNAVSGGYTIQVAYVDYFGEGTKSEQTVATVIDKITETLIDDNSISTPKLKANCVEADNIAINAIVAEKIDSNAIETRHIKAGAITAEVLGVDELSALTANIGILRTADTGARTEIRDNLILVYDVNNVLRVRMGVWE
jgi:hypothetical protein